MQGWQKLVTYNLKTQRFISAGLGYHSTSEQQPDWQTCHEGYALMLSNDVLELCPETTTNAGRRHRTDYWNVPAIEGKQNIFVICK